MKSSNHRINVLGPKHNRVLTTEPSRTSQVNQPSLATSSLAIIQAVSPYPSLASLDSRAALTTPLRATIPSLPQPSSLTASAFSFSAKPTPTTALSPGVAKRNAIIDEFCATDFCAELRATLDLEEERYFQTLKLAESMDEYEDEDEDIRPPYWDMIEKTSLLLDWLSAQPQELQNGFFESYDSGFVAELKSVLRYSRGIKGVLPVTLLGDRWSAGETPAGLSIDDRFLPPPRVANEPYRPIPLQSSVVAGTEEVCSILATAQAHGVEKSKGGLGTLVNILIEGHISPSNVFGMSRVCTGPMTRELDPSMSAGRHGPSYILMTPAFNQEAPDTSRGISCSYHRAYLVPTAAEARSLEVALDQAAEMGMITPAHAEACKDKILTYDTILKPASAPHPIAAQILEDAKELIQ